MFLRVQLTLPLLVVTAFSNSIHASTLNILDGGTQIGALTASNDPYGNGEEATFQLLSPYKSLMNDAAGTQFRFFQVIYYDDEPVTYQGKVITPPSAPAHSGTVVDTPAGGWDYELPGGDDYSPFYESDTPNNPKTGQPYAYPTLSYPDLHSDKLGYSSTSDEPGEDNPLDKTLFETFLAYVNPALDATHTFDLLGGYSWGIQNDPSDNTTGIPTANIPQSAITGGTIAELQGALDRSGFTGQDAWSVESVDLSLYAPVPEPSEWMLLCAGVLFLTGCNVRASLFKSRRLTLMNADKGHSEGAA